MKPSREQRKRSRERNRNYRARMLQKYPETMRRMQHANHLLRQTGTVTDWVDDDGQLHVRVDVMGPVLASLRALSPSLL